MAKSNTLQAIVEIAGTLSPTLEKSIGGVVDKLDGINVKALAVGAAAGGIAIATVKAVGEAGKALYELGTKFEAAENTIRVGTGATGDALDELMGDFDAIYTKVPTTMEAASQAVADYNTRLGLAGPVLQDVSARAIEVADLLGEDLSSVIEESSQAFQAWDIDANNMAGTMDYVFKASQSTGVGFTDLMSKVQQFGPQLQEMGYSFEEATTLIGQLDKAGVNTDEVLGAMKKSVAALAKDGISASDGLAQYAEAIQNAGDMTEAITKASEIFGTKAGSTMAAAIRDGTLSIEDLTTELEANGETILGCAEDTYTLSDRLQLFKQKAQVALEPLANTVLDSLTDLMPVVEDAMGQIIPVIGQLTEAIIPIVQQLVPQVLPLIGQLIPPIISMAGIMATQVIPPIVEIVTSLIPIAIQVLNSLMPIVQILIETVLPILVDIIKQIIPPVVQIITELLPVIQQILTALSPVITQLFVAISPVLTAISELISVLLPPIISMIQTLMPIITTCASIISTVLSVAIQALMPVIEGLISVVSTIADVFASAFTAAVGVIKGPINTIIGMVNGVISAINGIGFKIPDWVPVVGGKNFSIDLPYIPMLAAGGFTNGVSIAGEDGTEAVISFDSAYRAANIGYWAKAGQMLGLYNNSSNVSTSALAGELLALDDFSLSELASEGNTTVYDFSGMSYNPVVQTTESSPNIMAQLREAGQDFFDWLEAWVSRKERTAYDY
ncbi:MAG: phage tail tape measure protein [Blautia sp.]|nr:phage tail tape measure protein [Blautia sp.]